MAKKKAPNKALKKKPKKQQLETKPLDFNKLLKKALDFDPKKKK